LIHSTHSLTSRTTNQATHKAQSRPQFHKENKMLIK
jgi:hypothetical protein